MKVLKFKNARDIKLKFIKTFGVKYFDEYNSSFEEPIPETTIRIDELNLFKITDMPARRLVYVHFVEAVSPMIVWSGEEYDALQSFNKEDIYERCEKILNNMSDEQVSQLFDISMQEGVRLTVDEFKEIEIESDFTCTIHPSLFAERPKAPLLPPMSPLSYKEGA